MREILETIIHYSLEFDMFAPPFDEAGQLTVGELVEAATQTGVSTGKRVGYKLQEESSLNVDSMKKQK
jgi:hypothetical protein